MRLRSVPHGPRGGDATGSSNDALYFRRAGSGALTPMARRGRPAPVRLEDAPPNYTGENLWSALNRHGTFAYTDNDTGMWLANPTAANPFRFSTTLDRCWLGHRIGGRRQAVYIPVTRRGR